MALLLSVILALALFNSSCSELFSCVSFSISALLSRMFVGGSAFELFPVLLSFNCLIKASLSSWSASYFVTKPCNNSSSACSSSTCFPAGLLLLVVGVFSS